MSLMTLRNHTCTISNRDVPWGPPQRST